VDFAAVAVATLAVLAWTTGVTYQKAPPFPDRFVTDNGSPLMSAEDIQAGKSGFQRDRKRRRTMAQGQGKSSGSDAAPNMLGQREKFTAVPFLRSQHYDTSIDYVGHADKWDQLIVEGEIAARNCLLRFQRSRRVIAVASIFRDAEGLQAELIMEWDAAPARPGQAV
jgi:nitric oxide reductase large subunit